jgi:Txe/YoeB family toxin of Txe-Axe toxin-antitoxin module
MSVTASEARLRLFPLIVYTVDGDQAVILQARHHY